MPALGRRWKENSEISRRHDAVVDVRNAGFDEPPRLEPTPALIDLDGAYLVRPSVDVLEKMAVDRLQVREVEFARWHGLK